MMHLAHTRSLFIGRYEPKPPKAGTGGHRQPQQRRSNFQIEAAAVAQVRQGPRPEDVASARKLLSRPGLPDHLRAAAQATLTRAGATP